MSANSLYVRGVWALGALAAAAVLAGCQMETADYSTRALKPLSPAMIADLERKHMPRESPILVRLFKEESEFEVWKQDDTGRFGLLATYPICRWSGELGPKIKEGDRQAPEGFYTITPGQLNPNSHYYLAFDIGYPNAFDRAHGRTGGNLMVHGDCSSRGCYAMTDEQIGEIYALARESFFGGQRAFQVQAYPFRMTPVNMAKHRNNPNLAFWKMLKEGNDHFEVSRLEPKVDICEKRYIFDAEPLATPVPGAGRPTTFNPAGRCPAYQVPQEIVDAVKAKQTGDEIQTADLILRGTPLAPVRTGTDGGMNPVFLAKFKPTLVREADGTVRTLVETRVPGTVPAHAEPPRAPEIAVADHGSAGTATARSGTQSQAAMFGLAGTESKPAPSGAPSQSPGFFSRLFGGGGDGRAEPLPAAAQPTATAHATKPVRSRNTATAAAKPGRTQARAQAAQAAPQQPPSIPQAQAQAQAPAADNPSLIAGSQPLVPAGSFDSRWSGLR